MPAPPRPDVPGVAFDGRPVREGGNFCLAFNLFGDALRDVLSPGSRR